MGGRVGESFGIPSWTQLPHTTYPTYLSIKWSVGYLKSRLCSQAEETLKALATFQKNWGKKLGGMCDIKDRHLLKCLLTRTGAFRLDLQGARLHLVAGCEFFFSGSFSSSKDVTVYLKVGAQLLVLRERCRQRREALMPFRLKEVCTVCVR